MSGPCAPARDGAAGDRRSPTYPPRAVLVALALAALWPMSARAQQAPMMDATPAPLVAPESPPDAVSGLETYRERCASCHGPIGRGDGEMRDQLPAPPASFADPAYARNALPSDAFDVVTNGRLEKLMPPWGASLDVQTRWDVIFGAWSFYATPERLVRGRELWQAECAACHGSEPAAGDAETPLPLDEIDWWMDRSLADVFEAVSADTLASGAHAGLAELGREKLWSSLDYARSAVYTPMPFDALSLGGSISGKVSNGTAGESAVAGARVLAVPVGGPAGEILPTEPISTVLDASGVFSFTQLLAGPDMGYRLVASYEGADYFDDRILSLVPDAEGQASASTELTVYAVDDRVALDARLAQVVVAAQPEDGFVSMAEAWVIRNQSDRARGGDAVLRFGLPEAAAGLRFDDPRLEAGASFEDGIVTTTMPVPPGELSLLFSYGLPYEGDRLDLVRRLDRDVERLHVIALGEGVQVQSDQLPEVVVETRGGDSVTDASGEALPAGSELRVTITGLPEPRLTAASATRPLAPMPFEQRQLGLLGLALAVLGAVSAAVYPRLARDEAGGRALAALQAERERVVAKIAELDRALADDRIAPEAHGRRRAALVDRALALLRAQRRLEEDS